MPKKIKLSQEDVQQINQQASQIKETMAEAKPIRNLHDAAEVTKAALSDQVNLSTMNDRDVVTKFGVPNAIFTDAINVALDFSDGENQCISTLLDSGSIEEQKDMKHIAQTKDFLHVLDLSGSMCDESKLKIQDLNENDKQIVNNFNTQWLIKNVRSVSGGYTNSWNPSINLAKNNGVLIKYQELVLRFLDKNKSLHAFDRKTGAYSVVTELGEKNLLSPVIFRSVNSEDVNILRQNPNSPQAQQALQKYNFPQSILTDLNKLQSRNQTPYNPKIIYLDHKASIENLKYLETQIVDMFKTRFKPSEVSTPVKETIAPINPNLNLHLRTSFDGAPNDRDQITQYPVSYVDAFGERQRETVETAPSFKLIADKFSNSSVVHCIIGDDPGIEIINATDKFNGTGVVDDKKTEISGIRLIQGPCISISHMRYNLLELSDPKEMPINDLSDENVLTHKYYDSFTAMQTTPEDFQAFLQQAPGPLHKKLLLNKEYGQDITQVLIDHLGTKLLMQQGPALPILSKADVRSPNVRVPLDIEEYLKLTQIDLTQEEFNKYQDPLNPTKVSWAEFNQARTQHQNKPLQQQVADIFNVEIATKVDLSRLASVYTNHNPNIVTSFGNMSLSNNLGNNHLNPPPYTQGSAYPNPMYQTQQYGGYGNILSPTGNPTQYGQPSQPQQDNTLNPHDIVRSSSRLGKFNIFRNNK